MIDVNDSLSARMPNIVGYHVLRRIDAGGQAAVYAAESNSTGRLVAVKVLHDPAAAKRLEREARFLSSLSHPGIVTILDAGRDEDRVYLVTDFIEGVPIDDYINLEGCCVDAVVDLLIAACEAVSAAHAAGILHRDIKPANILVTEGRRCYIVDFGLAAEEDTGRGSSSSSGSIVGTVDYCPPERLRGAPADFRGDVYALGIVLYECLADNLPYSGETRFDRARAVVYDEPQRLRRAAAGERLNELLAPRHISRDLEAVVMKAIAKEPERRYLTVDALAADLRRCRAGDPVEARYGQRGYLARRLLGRYRAAVAAATVMVLTLAVGFAWATYAWRVAEESRARAERAVVHTQTALEMAGLLEVGEMERGSARIDSAIKKYESAVALAQSVDDPSSAVKLRLYTAHYRLAELFFSEQRPGDARPHAEAAIAVAEASKEDGSRDWRIRRATATVLRGKLAYYDEAFTVAAEHFLTAARAFSACGDEESEAWALLNAGRAMDKAGDAAQARGHLGSALEVYESLLVRHPVAQDIILHTASAENQLAAWHLRLRTENADREALRLVDGAVARLAAVTDPALVHDRNRLSERLQTNRDIAVKRMH